MNCLQFLFLFMGRPFLASCQNDPVVSTSLGSILGTVDASREGNHFYSFRGIRYAEAPAGDLRFKPPVPVTAWNGTFNATEDGPACYQKQLPDLSEDCLRLNVYTRRINDIQNSRPVLVHIHGGAFDHWSGQSTTHGPHYLMDYDIVLVTVNYRLGTLGFFSTGDKYAPGNYGMKDQVEALKWVQNHIKYFGGDPTRVTLSGQSAGGASVGLHLVSPMSKGLFHAAVIQSGSPINSRTINKNPLRLAIKQAVLLNCTTNSTEAMVDCVKKVRPEEIIKIYDGLNEKFDIGRLNSPVVESPDSECERFLNKDPLISLIEGDFANVPVLIGTTKDEYIIRAISKGNSYDILQNPKWTAELSEHWNEIAPIIFFYDRNDTISYKIRDFYLGGANKSITNDSLDGLADIFSDSYVIFTTIRTAKLIAARNTEPVYLYQFNYLGDGLQSCFKAGLQNRVAHEHDLLYIFNPSYVCPRTFNITTANGQFVTQFTTLIKHFVEEGNPTSLWEPYTNSYPKYLDINETLTLVNDLYYKERISFWENLFPLPH